MNEAVDPRLLPGGNNPPSAVDQAKEDAADIVARLEAIAERATNGPKAIKTEADLDTVGGIIRDAKAAFKDLDEVREKAKEPFLRTGQEIDSYFKPLKERAKRISDAFQGVADIYAKAVADAARAKAQEEARLAREEEARRLNAAMKAEEDNRQKNAKGHLAKAEIAAAKAVEAEAVAAAPVDDLTRTVTSSGFLSTAKEEWAFVGFTDYQAVPLDILRPYFKREDIEKAIRFAVRQGIREMAGVRIEKNTKAIFR